MLAAPPFWPLPLGGGAVDQVQAEAAHHGADEPPVLVAADQDVHAAWRRARPGAALQARVQSAGIMGRRSCQKAKMAGRGVEIGAEVLGARRVQRVVRRAKRR